MNHIEHRDHGGEPKMETVEDTVGGMVGDMADMAGDTAGIAEDMVSTVEDMADTAEDMGDMANDTRPKGLIRAARKRCPCDDNENVEGDPERSDTNNDTGNSCVNFPKVARH